MNFSDKLLLFKEMISVGRPMGGPEWVRRSMAGGVQIYLHRRGTDAAA